MTFEDWMRSERVTYKPSDDSVEDRALRRCWDAAVAAERERWETALRATWRMVDPLAPAGVPGSYARGFDVGVETALRTLRDNLGPNV